MSESIEPTSVFEERDALVERLFSASLAAMDLFSVYLGEKMRYYQALSSGEAMTSTQLATATDAHERYVREWLEQQAVTGLLEVSHDEADATLREFRLPPGHIEQLTDSDSLLTMTPLAQILAGCVRPIGQVLDAYRTGGGVPFEAYGTDLIKGQAESTRPMFRHQLTQEWLSAMPDVFERLTTGEDARIADIGMGLGLSSIAMAKAFPNVHVDGFDLDEASVAAARANAEEAGVADRGSFHLRDAGDPELADRYDLALAVECIHDMSDPVSTLRSMARLVGNGGTVFIADERVADIFTAPGDDVERYMYGFSILHCLPVGMVEQPSVATGTVMRSSTLLQYATEAGFSTAEVLPLEHDFFRFYRLTA